MARLARLSAAALALAAPAGCCRFYDRWCGDRYRPQTACAPVACCLPANTGYCAPVAAGSAPYIPPQNVPTQPVGYAPPGH